MTRMITVAALQPMLVVPGAGQDPAEVRAETLRRGAELVEEAGRRGATVACLPEAFPTMGMDGAATARLAEDETLPGLVELMDVAHRYNMTLVVGVHRRAADGQIYNAAAVVENGRLAGLYDTVHPTRSEREPPLCVTPGPGFSVFSLSWGKAGVLICHDNSFVESAHCLALAGAEVLFWPHAQSAWGDSAWEAVLRARAIDNGVWVVSSCFSVAAGRAWRPGMILGRSSIVAPDGTILADAGYHPGLTMTTIDLDRPRIAHEFCEEGEHPYRTMLLRYRRPAAYNSITTPLSPAPDGTAPEGGLS